MYLTIEIEYEDENGDYDVMEVEFEAYPKMQNDGIGAYEYWGCKLYDKGNDYVSLEDDPIWDRSKFTEHQNKIIENLPGKKWDDINVKFRESYEEEEYDNY